MFSEIIQHISVDLKRNMHVIKNIENYILCSYKTFDHQFDIQGPSNSREYLQEMCLENTA